MINVKIIRKAKSGGTGTGTATGGTGTGGMGTGGKSVKEAEHATRADMAERAMEAREAGHAKEAEHAKSAHTLDEDSPVRDEFLSKVKDDRTPHKLGVGDRLTAETELHVGEFERGLYGKGIEFDKEGRGELTRLFIREELTASRFVYNDIAVTKGEWWNTNGYCEIADVDTENHTITERLENNEYGSLRVDDICRGIYADIEGAYGSDGIEDGSVDACGFQRRKGYFTSYFRVTEIVTNEKGKFVFRYETKPRSPEPCALMNAAQYGNFTDKQRQSSMYFSSRGKSYVEVLGGVNSWEIAPQMKVARLGNLDGFIVRHKDGTTEELSGNGLFVQNNVYFGDAVISISNISDLDDLIQMASSYEVNLSQYQGVAALNSDGSIDGGLTAVVDGKTVYKLQTEVTVVRGGKTLLHHDGSGKVPEGSYRVSATGINCTEAVNGNVVAVSDIKDTSKGGIKVEIIVELEGKVTKTVNFPVSLVQAGKDGKDGKDGEDAYFIDLDNEMDAIPCDSDGKTTEAVELVTRARLYRGGSVVTSGIDVSAPADMTIANKTPAVSANYSGVVTIKWRFDKNSQFLHDRYTANVGMTYNNRTYTAVFTASVVKSGEQGVSPAVYQLLLSRTDASFARNSANELRPSYVDVNCGYTKTYKGKVETYPGSDVNNTVTDGGAPYNILYRGINADGTHGAWGWMKDLTAGGAKGVLRIQRDTVFTAYEFVLTSANGSASISDNNIIDRETLPINKDGLNGTDGKDGTNGKDGNGVSQMTTYYIATELSSGVKSPRNGTPIPAAGWVAGTYQPATAAKPYAWRYTETVYTNGKRVYTDAERIDVYKAGVNPNLLENTDFKDSAHMGAWTWYTGWGAGADQNAGYLDRKILTGADGVQGRNAYRGLTTYSNTSINYFNFIQQRVISKLKPSTWYTMSFWSRCMTDSLFYTPMTDGRYGFGAYNLYLKRLRTYYVEIKGYVSEGAKAAGKTLRAYIYKADWSWQKLVEIDSTTSVSKSITFNDVPSDGEFRIMFYSYPQSSDTTKTVTVERAYIRDLNMVGEMSVYGGVVDTAVKGYKDGVEQTLSANGSMLLRFEGWTYHTLTFKTKASLGGENAVAQFSVLPHPVTSRVSDGSMKSHGGTYIEICMPKLEEGMQATGYIPGQEDLQGYRGPMLRGPQAWTDVPAGYTFYQGTATEEYVDVVMDGEDFYYCMATHQKTAQSPSPKNDTARWKIGSRFDLVATKLLLAKYALVKNLGVEAIEMKDAKGNPVFVAKDGNVTCKTGTFENVTVSGTLEGVVGNFKLLDCIDSSGKVVGGIRFGSDAVGSYADGRLVFSGDILHQADSGNGEHFRASDIWCRGQFGAYQRTILEVRNGFGYFYTKGYDGVGVYVNFDKKTDASGRQYYELPTTGDYKYGENGQPIVTEANGMPVDTIVLNTDQTYTFEMKMADSQRILVVNTNDKVANRIWLNGEAVEWKGGYMAEVVCLRKFQRPELDKKIIGRGLFAGAFADNNWS